MLTDTRTRAEFAQFAAKRLVDLRQLHQDSKAEWTEYAAKRRSYCSRDKARDPSGEPPRPINDRIPPPHPLVGMWATARSCPPLTSSAINKAAILLRVSFNDVFARLSTDTDLSSARHNARVAVKIANGSKDIADINGKFTKTCIDCGSLIVAGSSVALRCPCCLSAWRKVQKKKHRDRQMARGYKAPSKRRCDEKHRSRIKTARRIARQLREIRASISAIEASISSDLLNAYRAKYKAEQKAFRLANAQAIARDTWRRAHKRRRNKDPTCNRGTERNWWMFDVYKEFGYVCAYCGMTREAAKLEGFDLQADHIIPLGAPGCVEGPDNTAPACIHCNASKGKRDMLEWSVTKGITPHPLALSKYHALKESHGLRKPVLQA
jgi:hypothetical protein